MNMGTCFHWEKTWGKNMGTDLMLPTVKSFTPIEVKLTRSENDN
jgi:hypothetical protein